VFSTGALGGKVGGCGAGLRNTNVKLKMRSSSFWRRTRKEGPEVRDASGSCRNC
jgi:hypothetical protein